MNYCVNLLWFSSSKEAHCNCCNLHTSQWFQHSTDPMWWNHLCTLKCFSQLGWLTLIKSCMILSLFAPLVGSPRILCFHHSVRSPWSHYFISTTIMIIIIVVVNMIGCWRCCFLYIIFLPHWTEFGTKVAHEFVLKR